MLHSYFLFVWIGVGYCIFRGAGATLQWMPRSWVIVSEDGDDPIWKADNFAGIAAFFGSLWLLDKMEKLAERLEQAERKLRMDRIARILNNLMPALRRLAGDKRTEQTWKGAKLAIWRSYSPLGDEADKKSFREELRSRAIDEEENAPTEDEQQRLFWKEVAQEALAPIQPEL